MIGALGHSFLNNAFFRHFVPHTYYLSPITYYLSPITYYLLPITYHLSPITYHLLPITSPLILLPFARETLSRHHYTQ